MISMAISVVMIVKLHSEAGEFQYFLHPNEPPQRILLYLGRQLVDLLKVYICSFQSKFFSPKINLIFQKTIFALEY